MCIVGVFLPKLLDMASVKYSKNDERNGQWKEYPENDWYCRIAGSIDRLLAIAGSIIRSA